MANIEKSRRRKASPYRSELQEARPLLQAIVLGVLLATGLMAAAAMATPESERAVDAAEDSIVLEADTRSDAAPNSRDF